jgi:hypothetical protein
LATTAEKPVPRRTPREARVTISLPFLASRCVSVDLASPNSSAGKNANRSRCGSIVIHRSMESFSAPSESGA